jgi:vanillate O-demethylase ferredoxin subunit
MDLTAIVNAAPAGSHFYCCGPAPMLSAFEKATKALPPEQVHVEYFESQADAATSGGFTVRLARSGKDLRIAPGQTILDALEAAGVAVSYSCRKGICGACETKVLAGTPDHRDTVLTATERASNRTMMVCCSGSLSSEIVLDI